MRQITQSVGKVWAVVPAAGTGSRMGTAIKKQFMELAGVPIIARTITILDACPIIDGIVVVTASEDMDQCQEILLQKHRYHTPLHILPGGATRQESVYLGLKALPSDCAFVLIHDGARPLVDPSLIEASVQTAATWGGCIVAVPAKDTIKVADDNGFVKETPPRQCLWNVQTPQTFQYAEILYAYEQAMAVMDLTHTDDSSIAERYGSIQIKLLQGSYSNIKITTPEDLTLAEQILRTQRPAPTQTNCFNRIDS